MHVNVDHMITATGAHVVQAGAAVPVQGVGIDSRRFVPGQWFVAIHGAHFDGHDFVGDVLRRGAAGVIVAAAQQARCAGWQHDTQGCTPTPWIVHVVDPIVALGALAALWRQQCTQTAYVGITGSNGKSTTKEMIASIAAARGAVLKTVGNYNNLIGLPLTLCLLQPEQRTAVIEMGMSAAGEIAQLTKTLDPDVGVITNVTAAHLDTLRTVDNVARAKGELFAGMRRDATIVVNAEDPWVCSVAEGFAGRRLTFGMKNGCDVQFGRMFSDGLAGSEVSLYVQGHEYRTQLPVPGTHNVMNALAATAVGLALEIPVATMMERIPHFTPMRMRMERVQLANGVQVINDCYNANPESMCAALRTVGAAKRAGRFVAVLGDMLELGGEAETRHQELGRHVVQYGVEQLFVVGAHAADICAGAQAAGLTAAHIVNGGVDTQGVQQQLAHFVQQGDVVLVKASRGMQLEQIVDGLKRTIGVD